mmetsp:Transcript_115654/g.162554  ORF Transcript_115654/g.162554 Transcript_115654/m.162554 type:complete len:254 (+) Transcript_115654:2-763(+)
MCFNQPMSFAMAAFGFLVSALCLYKSRNLRLSGGVFFFFTMEFLQGFQYFWIDDCGSTINQVLTYLGFIHIVWQPFFTHLICSSLALDKVKKGQYSLILGLCAIGAVWLLARSFVAATNVPITAECPTTEWIRGTELCTYSGNLHLAWSIPLGDQTYFWPGASVHFFLMFAPFMVMGRTMAILGTFLMITGPVLASYITSNLQEQASIWCFYSCVQTFAMLCLYVAQHGVPIHLSIRRTRLAQEAAKKAGKKA